jgi:hypothetical protein
MCTSCPCGAVQISYPVAAAAAVPLQSEGADGQVYFSTVTLSTPPTAAQVAAELAPLLTSEMIANANARVKAAEESRDIVRADANRVLDEVRFLRGLASLAKGLLEAAKSPLVSMDAGESLMDQMEAKVNAAVALGYIR